MTVQASADTAITEHDMQVAQAKAHEWRLRMARSLYAPFCEQHHLLATLVHQAHNEGGPDSNAAACEIAGFDEALCITIASMLASRGVTKGFMDADEALQRGQELARHISQSIATILEGYRKGAISLQPHPSEIGGGQ